jgi:histidinol dehydrogenase
LKLKILSANSQNFNDEWKKILSINASDNIEIEKIVKSIISEVKVNKDDALIEHIKRFDRWNPKSKEDLIVSKDEIKQAYLQTDKELIDALNLAKQRIEAYAIKQLPKSWLDYEDNASILGQKITPVSRAGLYIPGGKASYPSSMLMNAIPAKVAGVKEIIACVPTPDNELNPLVLASAYICGVDTIYKIGGASAISAMAFGTDMIKKVDVISGPGNIFVATAKKLLFGEINIDMIAGPSEIGIIADSSADANLVAIDLLSQAEHDEMARTLLITDDINLAKDVQKEVEIELDKLPRKDIATKSIKNNSAIVVV